jgi:hypothetical protein
VTDIEAKALALVNEVFIEKGGSPIDYAALVGAGDVVTLALCRAIEQHEAFKQEVSDVVRDYSDNVDGGYEWGKLMCLIIPKPKPDPLVDVLADTFGASLIDADELRAALEVRGLEIREIPPPEGDGGQQRIAGGE